MRTIAVALIVLVSACGGPQQSNASSDALARLIGLGIFGAGAAAHGAAERAAQADGTPIHYPPDAYFCATDSLGGEEIRAPSAERAHEHCVALHGHRSSYRRHCRCELLQDHY